jgi:hypothetical protein
MGFPGRSPRRQELGARLDRYSRGSVLRKATMRLLGQALSAAEKESLRRRAIGSEGRVAEDTIRAVTESEPIWPVLAERDLPEDLTVRELDAIAAALRGCPADRTGTDSIVGASLLFGDQARMLMLREIIPSDLLPPDVTGYRYATLMRRSSNTREPFIVTLRSHGCGENTVAATVLVAATFLRFEQELGVLTEDAVRHLEVLVGMDLAEIVRTRRLLLEA